MSYCSWHIYGYGIRISDITEESVKRLEALLSLAPEYYRKVRGWLCDCEISEPNYDDYLDFDQDFQLGLATILKEVILETENVELTACDDYDGRTYLVYEPRYPWRIPDSEIDLCEERLERIFQKYVPILTDEVISIDYQEIENGG